jgi:error-prone DNA polymerase
MPSAYIELHARSAFSFLRGGSSPEDYANECNQLQQSSMALLDVDGVYGLPRFYKQMGKFGLRAHIGAEVTCTDGARYPLLVETRQGYQNLCRLISRMKLRTTKHPKPGKEPAATWDELEEFSQGLICLSGDEDGPLPRDLSKAAIDRLRRIFGKDNVYLELQRHGLREQEARNQAVIELARGMKMPIVATNGVCYANPAHRELLDVFT